MLSPGFGAVVTVITVDLNGDPLSLTITVLLLCVSGVTGTSFSFASSRSTPDSRRAFLTRSILSVPKSAHSRALRAERAPFFDFFDFLSFQILADSSELKTTNFLRISAVPPRCIK